MVTMIVISSVAVLVALVGCALIWGFDALRAEEISTRVPVSSRSVAHLGGEPVPSKN